MDKIEAGKIKSVRHYYYFMHMNNNWKVKWGSQGREKVSKKSKIKSSIDKSSKQAAINKSLPNRSGSNKSSTKYTGKKE